MFRRDFLKNMGLAGAAIAAPTSLVMAEEVPASIDISTTLLKGRITHATKGIAGVAVSDGLNVCFTDKNGRYRLLSNKTRRFVYYSTPAGYEIAQEQGMAKFYKAIEHGKGEFYADFELKKLPQSDDKHAFVVWADTQILSAEDADFLKQEPAPDLRKLVQQWAAERPIHGIGCGDLVWDKFELFKDYKEAIASTGVTFFNVIGNHDMDLDARSDELSTKRFEQEFGPTYYSYNRGKVHYVVLDDVFFIGVSKKYIGYLTEQQFQWLEQDLQQVPKDHLLIVSLHIPTFSYQSKRDGQKEPSMGGVVMNRQRLYDILAPYQTHIMSGHTHFNEVIVREQFTEHVHGTVCGAWWTGPICSDGTPNGYGVYEVVGNKLSWFYKSTGKNIDHQLRIYPKGTLHTAPDEVLMNIWNWDKNWKVEWYENEVLQGEPIRRAGLDPWAYERFKGNKRPAKHPFVEPTQTDHLFFCKPSAQATRIKVIAQDPFGRQYQEEINW